jgi:hypothetical protein
MGKRVLATVPIDLTIEAALGAEYADCDFSLKSDRERARGWACRP